MKHPNPARLPMLLAAACALSAGARAGTITVEGDQAVAGNQGVGSNQVVGGSLVVSNASGGVGLEAVGPAARVAGTRLLSLGANAADRWIRVARIGGAGESNALFAGRVLAEGGGADYAADFAFPAAPQSGPYAALLVEMGAATNFAWGVWADGGSNHVWFLQPAGSRFANFLYAQEGCAEDWAEGTPTGTNVWSGASGGRGTVRAGSLGLSGAGLWLPDGTLLDARSNMTAAAIADGTNVLLSASGGRLVVGGPADFSGAVTLPETVLLGTNGVTLSAERWGMVDSSFTNGATWARGLSANLGATIRGMAADTSGNRYVYGGFAGTMSVGATSLQSGTASADPDLAGFVVKFGPDGSALWAKSFPATNHSANGTPGQWLVEFAAAGTDAAGNLYLGGALRAPATIGGSTRTPSGGGDGLVLSLDPSGGLRWIRQLGGSHANPDSIADIDVDAAGTNIVAGGTVWGQSTYCDPYSYETYHEDDSNGYAARLNGSGTVVSEWSLGGWAGDGGTWAFGHEYSEETSDHWNTAVERVCGSAGGAVVWWTHPDEGGRIIRKVGGASQWSMGQDWAVRDILPLPGGDTLLLRGSGFDWNTWEGTPASATRVGASGSVAWTRSGSWGEDPNTSDPAETRALVDAIPEAGGDALLAWRDAWWTYEDPDYIGHARDVVERIGSGGAVVWTNALPEGAAVARLDIDGAGTLHAYGSHSGAIDLGAAGSLGGGGAFHLRFSGATSNLLALSAAPAPSGTLVGLDASGEAIALACSGPPPGYIHSDPAATSISVGGILDASRGLRLADGTVLTSAGDLAAAGAWLPGSAGGSYWYSGNVGIGTADPSARLDVSGDARVSGSISSGSGQINLGTGGVSLTAARWGALDSGLQLGGEARTLSASGYASIRGMVEDASGNRYAYGAFAGTMDLGGGTVLSSATTQNDRAGFVLKLDPLGYLLWAQAFPLVNHSANGQQNEMLVEIASGKVDGSGNLVLGGTFRARAMFAGTDQTPQGAGDAFAVCLKPDGARLWFQKWSGGGTAADGVSDLALAPGGTNLWIGGTWAKSGGSDTDGMVRRIKASDGNTITNWTLAGNPGDTNAADVASSVSRVCAASNDVAVAWEAGSARSVRRLGGAPWWCATDSGFRKLLPGPEGAVIEYGDGTDGLGRIIGRAAGTGEEQWAYGGYSVPWEDEYGYGEDTRVLGDAVGDGAGHAVCVASYSGWSYDYEYYDYYQYSYQRLVLLGTNGTGQTIWDPPSTSCRLAIDSAGNLHLVSGSLHVRFQGIGGGVALSETVATGAGALVDLVSTAEALTLAYDGPPPSIVQNAAWETTLAVDGYLSAGSGLRLADGTMLGGSGDIVALGPVQFGSGGAAYYSGGNFGIGTASPTHGLEVAGDALIGGAVVLGDDLTVVGSLRAQGAGALGVEASLVVSGDITAGGVYRAGTNAVQLTDADGRLRPEAMARRAMGDIPMGAFTNGPAQ